MTIEQYAKQQIQDVGRNGLAASNIAEAFNVSFAFAWMVISTMEVNE